MKKLISIFLSITILAGMFIIPTSAATTKNENNGFNINNGTISAFDGTWIYYIKDKQIRKFKNDGTKDAAVYTANNWIYDLYVYDGYIYYNLSGSGINKVKTDGTKNQVLVKSDDIRNYQVVNGYIYFVEYNKTYNLCSVKTDGTGKKTIVKNVDTNYKFFVSSGYIYYAATRTVKVQTWTENVSEWIRIKTDGTGKKTYDFKPNTNNLIVDNGNIYYDNYDNKFFCLDTKGKTTELKFTLAYNDKLLGIYDGVVYYFTYDDTAKVYKLMQMNLDGTGKKVIVKLKSRYSDHSFNISGGWIIYEDDGYALYARSLDGKQKKTLKKGTTTRTDIGM